MLQCREVLSGYKHLISSSKVMVREVQRLRFDDFLMMIKLDIKDFYIVGEHHVLSDAVARLFPDVRLRSLVWDVVYYLLDNQYVADRGADGETQYKVRYGTGIGLLHSGDLADAVFFSLVEKKLLEAKAYDEGGVLYWCRFRDDMCFIVNKPGRFKTLLEKMRNLSQFFSLQVEEASTVELRYLDVVLKRQLHVIETEPFLKDPGLSRKLARTSAHPVEIHKAWPKMLMRGVNDLTNSEVSKSLYRNELLIRLKQDGCLLPSSGVKHHGPLPNCSVLFFRLMVAIGVPPLVVQAYQKGNCQDEQGPWPS